MSFRLSSLNICRAGIIGFACLAFAGASRAGEGSRNIEIVPRHDGTPLDTNFDESSPADGQTLKAWLPSAPNGVRSASRPGQAMILSPPPRQQTTISLEREKELLDRRKNWVFMTPEDYASSDDKKSELGDKDVDAKPTTAMQRFYQHLYDVDRPAATNQFNKSDSTRFGQENNSPASDLNNSTGGAFGENSFSTEMRSGVFQSAHRSDFSNPFGSDNNSSLRTPEEIRMEAEQKAHMESFRQLWNIDQPAAPAAPTPAPVSTPIDSGPLFGFSSPALQPAHSISTPDNVSSVTHSEIPMPTVDSARAIKPPHATFVPQQRPF